MKSAFTLLEVMIASAIIGGSAYMAMQGFSFVSKAEIDISYNLELDTILEELINNINSNFAVEKIDNNPDDPSSVFKWNKNDLIANARFAWDRKNPYHLIDTNERNKGRLDYAITPLPLYRGLYKVVIKVYHPDIIKEEEGFRTYLFLVGD